MCRRGGSNSIRAEPLYGPLPHFYAETQAYLNGDIGILDKLPAVQASALHKAKQSKTRAIPPANHKLSHDRLERSHKTQEQVLQARHATYWCFNRRTPTLPPVTDKPAFSDMVQHEMPLFARQAVPRHRTADEKTPDSSLRRPVYDGLRSS
ncbi:hypothetical protein C8A00DRAFT_14821, partial [Chaetomidium leptoderma]